MAFDYRDVVNVVKADDPKLTRFRGSVTDVILWYLKNKDGVNAAVGNILNWLKDRQHSNGPTTPAIPTLPPAPITPPAPLVVPTGYPQIVSKLDLDFLFLEDDRHGGSVGEIIKLQTFKEVVGSGPAAQMKGQRMHINCTPYDLNGKPYPGQSPIIRKALREDGKQPCLDYKWWVDNILAWNSTEMDDPFSWESYEDDGGCTPNMLLETIEGGVRQAKLQANWPAQYNGGVEVISNFIYWRID